MAIFSRLSKSTSRGLPLWLEILVVLLIKLIALYFLRAAFFSQPQTKHMRLPTPTVEQHLLWPGTATPAYPPASAAADLAKTEHSPTLSNLKLSP
ncbi:cytochrome oxidase putative small subunit CydP [Undibacterium sp.]|uniref:cytochrome oxidase putative small subunit CydP n=1 Tax=Undibacterium sp. TaxID=1914977 RepID=UPI0025D587A0|nr:cytochrome oxidase putative small subunit CydP [Undibacterium sp.]